MWYMPSYFYNRNSYTGKIASSIETPHDATMMWHHANSTHPFLLSLEGRVVYIELYPEWKVSLQWNNSSTSMLRLDYQLINEITAMITKTPKKISELISRVSLSLYIVCAIWQRNISRAPPYRQKLLRVFTDWGIRWSNSHMNQHFFQNTTLCNDEFCWSLESHYSQIGWKPLSQGWCHVLIKWFTHRRVITYEK